MSSLTMSGSLVDSVLLVYHANPRLALALSFGLVFAIYYLLDVAKRPRLVCREGKFRNFLISSCHILQERYWPTLWCFGTHAQTAIANMMRGRMPNLAYYREIIQLEDGGIVALDWLDCRGSNPKEPLALFLPGLTGHSQTEYIKSVVPVGERLGCRCVVFNNRGRGGVQLKTPKTYCAVNTEDLTYVLAHIKKLYPQSPIIATGISLGGIIIGHYLAEMSSKSLISAAVLISVPWDIHAGVWNMEVPGLDIMLNKVLARNLCDSVRPYSKEFEKVGIDMEHVLKSRTIREFDERFTTNLFGFASVDDYYTQATLRSKLGDIKVPVLCVNAADDMFAPFTSLPIQEVESSDNMGMVITSRGGHIGFMEGFLPIAPFFSERLYEQFLKGLLDQLSLSNDLTYL